MSTDKNNIFEVSVSYTEYCSIRVRANSETEAIQFVEDNLHSGELNWKDGDAEYSISEVYEDGQDFDVNLITEENNDQTDEPIEQSGTLYLVTAPSESLVVVKDSAGKRYELRIKDKVLVSSGICNWEAIVDGQVILTGTYDIYPNEQNPLLVK